MEVDGGSVDVVTLQNRSNGMSTFGLRFPQPRFFIGRDASGKIGRMMEVTPAFSQTLVWLSDMKVVDQPLELVRMV